MSLNVPSVHKDRRINTLDAIGLPEVPLVGWFLSHTAREELEPHQHDGIEVCYLKKGHQIYHLNGRDYVLRGGDVFFTLPDEVHSTGGYPQEQSELFWFQVVPFASGHVGLGLTATAMSAILDDLQGIEDRCFAAGPGIVVLFDRLYVLAADAAPGDEGLIAAIVAHILAELPAHAGTLRDAPSSAVSAAIEYIERNLDRRLVIAEIAEAAAISASWLQHRFRSEMGVPIGEYLHRRKIEKARNLIVETDLSITAIAYDLGFSSSQNFATAYRRATGESPSETRAR